MHKYIASGATLLAALGAGALIAAGAPMTHAQPLPPRPTVVPTEATPTQVAVTPVSVSTDPVAPGRITGTVINLATGAPAPGIAVRVGDITVVTDLNGNYDRSGIAPGSYELMLEIAPVPRIVRLEAGATVVQHLTFGSVPAAVPIPVVPVVPEQLPATGASNDILSLLALGLGLLAAGAGLRRSRR